MFGSVREIAMFMLYLVLAFLLLTNYTAFNSILGTVGSNWRSTLRVLQGR
jgi:hypothetical protein